MIGAAAAYMAGLFFASFFTGIYIPIFIASAALLLTIGRKNGFSQKDVIMLVIVFSVGCGATLLRNEFYCKKLTAYNGSSGTFSGTVKDIKHYEGDKAAYTLQGRINESQKAKVSFYTSDLSVKYGDTISVENCVFSVPEGDYLFDSESYYKSEGIYLSIVSAKGIEVVHNNSNKLKNALIEHRDEVISELRIKLGDENGDLLAGMLFGVKQNMDESVKRSLYRCGIGHILAVSGLHVSIIAMAIMRILGQFRMKRAYSLIVTDLIIALFILMADVPLSAVRAAVMMNFVYAAGIFRRQNDTFNSLAVSVLLIAVFDPDCIYSRGFILSIAGTFGIGVWGPYMTAKFETKTVIQRVWKSFIIMLCTMLFILPFSMKYFGETSLISPVTNILILPLCSASLIAGALYVISFGVLPVLWFADLCLCTVTFLTDRLSKMNGIYFSCGSERVTTTAFALLCAVILVHIIFQKRHITGISAALSFGAVMLVSALYGARMYDTFVIAELGKGSNSAIVITYKGATDIVDLSGNYKSPEYVHKYLTENAIAHIDTVVLTKKVHSQYSAYLHELDINEKTSWIMAGDASVYGDKPVICYGDEGYILESSHHTVRFENKLLSIEYDGRKIVIAPASVSEDDVSDDTDLLVIYGSSTSVKDIGANYDVIYLDKKRENSMNNFEIKLPEKGGYRIRRL